VVYATSIFPVTNFRVVSPRLSILLFFSSCHHREEFVLVLSRRRAVTICCERAGVSLKGLASGAPTPHHKFPSCSKTNRVELIRDSLSSFPEEECAFTRIYTRLQYILSVRIICYWQRSLLTIALRQNIRICRTDTFRTESSSENVSSNNCYKKKKNMITQKSFICDILW